MSASLSNSVKVQSPGRINLIGEHIDYNGGHVLPAAITHTITLVLSKNGKKTSHVRSNTYNDAFEFEINNLQPSETGWHNYVLGVVNEMLRIKPESLCGFNCEITSNLPVGAGVSSSAGLECGMAAGLNALFGMGYSADQLITLSRDAEHNFVGTKCGIMDQFAVVKGREDHFILLNCRNNEYEYVRADLAPYELLLINSNVSHDLSTSAYNKRREECEAVLEFVNNSGSRYEFLVDVPGRIIEQFKEDLTPSLFNRASYVINENQRVLLASEALRNKSLPRLGALMYESHAGLRDLYEVSCDELDFMVDFARNFDYILGSRMMGGGFGGCTLNLIHKTHTEEYIRLLSSAYRKKFGKSPTPIRVNIGNGVSLYNEV